LSVAFFFVERLTEKFAGFLLTEQMRPRHEGAIGDDYRAHVDIGDSGRIRGPGRRSLALHGGRLLVSFLAAMDQRTRKSADY
jgi:hypothetical protein